MERTLLWAALVTVALGAETFVCPADEPTGKFADPDYCDLYWECYQGEATPVDCADGFGFDPARVRTQEEPCDYLFSVNCTGRELLADPQGTGVCERRNGIYPHEDPNVCNKYYTCENDKAKPATCPPGLHFRLDTQTCDWPAMAKRGTCETKQSLGDFTCDPSVEYFTPAKQKIVHPTFPHPDDCRKFYVCKNGREPALSSCNHGLVYNIDDAKCDLPVNVPDCETYYDEPEAPATKPKDEPKAPAARPRA